MPCGFRQISRGLFRYCPAQGWPTSRSRSGRGRRTNYVSSSFANSFWFWDWAVGSLLWLLTNITTSNKDKQFLFIILLRV